MAVCAMMPGLCKVGCRFTRRTSPSRRCLYTFLANGRVRSPPWAFAAAAAALTSSPSSAMDPSVLIPAAAAAAAPLTAAGAASSVLAIAARFSAVNLSRWMTRPRSSSIAFAPG